MSGWRIGGIAAAVLVAIGAFLPWATIEFFGSMSVNGVEGSDGKLTLFLAVAAGVLVGLWKRPTVIIGAVLFVLTAIIGFIDLIDVGRVAGEAGGFVEVSPGFGLILTLIAGLGGAAVAFVGQMQLGNAGQATGLSIAELNRGAALPTTSLPPQNAGWPQAGAPATAQPVQPVAPAQPAVPAGWHPDPTVPGQLRYWDGATWTEHVQAAPQATPPTAPPPPPAG